jgi:hypothetical protein
LTRNSRSLLAGVGLLAIGAAAAGRFVHGSHAIALFRALVGASAESARLPDLERRFPGWQVTAFHRPHFDSGAGGVTVTGGRDPSGVFFRTTLDAGSVYRLLVQGRARGPMPVIRLRFDGQPDSWRTLDVDGAALVLPQTSHLEALLYADGPYAYELRSLTVERCAECVTDAVRVRVFPGWVVTPYVSTPVPAPYPREQQVMWTAGDNVELRGAGSASGALLTRRLDAAVTYRLVLHGERRNAAPALRLKLDDRPFMWHTVDRGDGDLNLVLPRAERLEALLYSDAPYTFDVHSLIVEPCRDCITDETLRRRIAAEAAVGAGDPPLVTARKVRDWVEKTVVFGQDPADIAVTTNAVMTEPAWQPYVDIFVPHRGGVWCGGIARYYQKILAVFELPSLTVDIGYEGTELTHVTTLVDVMDQGARRFYVLDPTFAAAYMNAGGYVDLGDLLSGKRARFEMDPMSRVVLIPTADAPAFQMDVDRTRGRATCGPSSTLPGVSECVVADHNRYNLVTMRRAMARKGLGSNGDFIISLIRHRVIAIHGSELDPPAADELRRQLARFGVPVSSVN